MKRKVEALTIVLVVALLAAPAALAQYSSSKPQYARLEPYGPYQPIYHDWFQEPGGQPAGEEDAEQPESEADSAPLAGADSLKLSTGAEHPNFLQPRFNFTQRLDSGDNFRNPFGISVFSGSLELYRKSRKRELSLEYAGGTTVYDDGRGSNRSYHQLRLRESFQGKRWALMLGNETSYTPEAPFSFIGSGGVFISGTFDINGVSHSFTNAILPIQTLTTGRSNRTGTSSVGQLQYRLGARSSFFVTGAYGLLAFEDPKLLDSRQTQLITGYQRSLSNRNSLGITYGYGMYRFSKGVEGINNHTIQGTFGRRLTNRMAMRLGGGPQFSMFHDLVQGDQTKVLWTVDGSLLYSLPRTTFGFSYSRHLSGGSGVLAGSQTDLVRFTANRLMGRQWSMSVQGGYAHNSAVQAFTLTPARQTYDSQYGGIRFMRHLSRDRSLSFGYTLSHQNFVTPDCVSAACQDATLRHSFDISFEWLPRPFRLD